MGERRNRVNSLNAYDNINTINVTGTTVTMTTGSFTTSSGSLSNYTTVTVSGDVTAGNVKGLGLVTGSTLKVEGPSGSIRFDDLYSTTTGSIVAALGLKVVITGSTYVIPCYSG